MENKKDIGKAFREKLDGLHRSPGESAWNAINAGLKKNRRQSLLPRWFNGTVIALAIVFCIGFFTYPLWREHVPAITITMPDAANTDEGRDGSLDTDSGAAQGPDNAAEKNKDEQNASGSRSETNEQTGPAENNAAGNKGSSITNASAGSQYGSGRNTGTVAGASSKSNGKAGAAITPGSRITTGVNKITEDDNDVDASRNDGKRIKEGTGTGKKSAKSSGRPEAAALKKIKNTEAVTGNGKTPAKNAITGSGSDTTAAKQLQERPPGNKPNSLLNSNGSTAPDTSVAASEKKADSAVPNVSKNTAPEKDMAGTSKTSSAATNDSGAPSRVPGKEGKNTDTTGITPEDSVSSATPETVAGNASDTIAAPPLKTIPMDFAKVADSLNKLYGREDHRKTGKIKDTIPYKKFHLYAFGAASYYNLPDNGSYIDASLANNISESKVSIPFGTYVGYSLSRKCIVRVGIILTKFQQTVTGVRFNNTYIEQGPDAEHPDGWTQTKAPRNFSGITYRDGISNDIVRQQLSTGSDERGNPQAIASVYSRTEFMEIPFEVLFEVYDSKIGVDLLCGFSMRSLRKNSVYAQNAAGEIQLGAISGADRKLKGYAATLGANFNYMLTSHLQLNAEPVLRYYFDSYGFGETYTLGIQAGIQYNFDFVKRK